MIIRAPVKQNVVRCGAGTASHVQQPKARKVSDQVSTYFSLNRMESLESLEPAGAIDHWVQKVKSRLVPEEAALGFYSQPWP
jgi:hypothetical protein